MTNLTKKEFVHILRRQSIGFSRGTSKYREVTLHKCGLWEAQMEHFLGKKFLLLCLSTWKFEYGFFSFHCHKGLQGFLLHCGFNGELQNIMILPLSKISQVTHNHSSNCPFSLQEVFDRFNTNSQLWMQMSSILFLTWCSPRHRHSVIDSVSYSKHFQTLHSYFRETIETFQITYNEFHYCFHI